MGAPAGGVRQVPLRDRGVREGRWHAMRSPMPTVSRSQARHLRTRATSARRWLAAAAPSTWKSATATDRRARTVDLSLLRSPGRPRAMVRRADGRGTGRTRRRITPSTPTCWRRSGRKATSSTSRAARSSTRARSSTALRDGRIAGAGLDVIEGEPAVPPELAADARVVLSPHIGGHGARRDAPPCVRRCAPTSTRTSPASRCPTPVT